MGLIYKKVLVKGNKSKRTLRVLMDTGASYTVVRAAIAHKLCTPAPLARSIAGQFAKGRGVIKETVNLALRLDGHEVMTPALVLVDLSEELIVGAEFFQRYKILLDPEREDIRFTDPEALKVKII